MESSTQYPLALKTSISLNKDSSYQLSDSFHFKLDSKMIVPDEREYFLEIAITYSSFDQVKNKTLAEAVSAFNKLCKNQVDISLQMHESKVEIKLKILQD